MEHSAFPEVVGHSWAKELLSGAFRSGRLPHALLLTGPPAVGKTTLAKALAKALNCRADQPPCNHCSSCRKVESGNHPDVRIFDSEEEAIHIEQVRDLQGEFSLRPHEGNRRVAVFAHFQRATLEAANALLKTLEEPPAGVLLILTAPEAGLLLPTIVSRCQVLALRVLSSAEMFSALMERWGASREDAEALAHLAQGRLGWAVRALQRPEVLEERRARLEQLQEVLHGGRAARLTYARRLSEEGGSAQQMLHLWLGWWRDALLQASGGSSSPANVDRVAEIEAVARRYDLPTLFRVVQAMRAGLGYLERNANSRLVLEAALLAMPVERRS